FSFFLLISLSTLKFLVAGLLYPDQMDTVVFLHLSRALAISYLLACIVFYCGTRWVKVLFYAIGLMLFSVNLFAWLVFHKTFSPHIFVLLGETNYREATESC
ncbi:MAG: arylsulfatase, partial [Prevotella sp.]|nr:arylsulfatase [Prevotella sp.]